MVITRHLGEFWLVYPQFSFHVGIRGNLSRLFLRVLSWFGDSNRFTHEFLRPRQMGSQPSAHHFSLNGVSWHDSSWEVPVCVKDCKIAQFAMLEPHLLPRHVTHESQLTFLSKCPHAKSFVTFIHQIYNFSIFHWTLHTYLVVRDIIMIISLFADVYFVHLFLDIIFLNIISPINTGCGVQWMAVYINSIKSSIFMSIWHN